MGGLPIGPRRALDLAVRVGTDVDIESVAVTAAAVIELRTEGRLSTLAFTAGLPSTRVSLLAATIGTKAGFATGGGL